MNPAINFKFDFKHSVSGREKTAWICFATTVLVYVPYFVYAARPLYRSESLTVGGFIAPLLGAVAAQSAACILAALVFLLPHRSEPKDERDLALEARSFRWSYYVLGFVCFSVVMSLPGMLVTPLAENSNRSVLPILIAETLLLGFVVAEATRYLVLAVGYRRGA